MPIENTKASDTLPTRREWLEQLLATALIGSGRLETAARCCPCPSLDREPLSSKHWIYEQRPSEDPGTGKHRPLQHCTDEVQDMPRSGLLQHLKRGPHKPLQHWEFAHGGYVQKAPKGWQDDCAATGRGFRLSAATVRITNTATLLNRRKRVIAFLLLTVFLTTVVLVLDRRSRAL